MDAGDRNFIACPFEKALGDTALPNLGASNGAEGVGEAAEIG